MVFSSDARYILPTLDDRDAVYAADLALLLSQLSGTPVRLGADGLDICSTISLPETLRQVLETAAFHLAEGRAVSVVPHDTVLTVGEAAELMGVSRAAVGSMIATGKLVPCDGGAVLLADVLVVKESLMRRPSLLRSADAIAS